MATPSRGLVWELLSEEQIFVSYYDQDGTDQQWQGYYAILKSVASQPSLRIFVYCIHAPPPSALEGIVRVVRGKPWLVSIVSASTAVRFAASTFSLVIRTVRFFNPDALPDACNHLGCTPAEQTKVLATLERLRGAPAARAG